MLVSLTIEDIQACTGADYVFAARYEPYLNEFCPQYGIYDTLTNASAFLATASVESNKLESLEEGLYYKDPVRLAKIFRRVFDLDKDTVVDPEEVEFARTFVRKPKELSNILYNGKHGRGLIQLTWVLNYERYEQSTGAPVVDNPDLLLEPLDAVRSACWFWQTNGCNEASMPKYPGEGFRSIMKRITGIVNGPALMHLEERTKLFEHGYSYLASKY